MTQRKYQMPLLTGNNSHHGQRHHSPDRKMASISTRLRRYFIHTRPSRLAVTILAIGSLVLLCCVFFSSSHGSKYGVTRKKFRSDQQRMDNNEINNHFESLRDTRPTFCNKDPKIHAFNFSKVSILLDFSGDEFYNLKLTLSSILKYTDENHYHEILVIDDGSDRNRMYDIHKEFFQQEHFKKVKVYRPETGDDDKSASRMKASHLAAGTFLVFVSSDVVVNTGWLLPLIQQVLDEPRAIAVPHHDNFLAPHRFFQTDDRLVNVPTWMLSTVHREVDLADREVIPTPVMRGDAFAIHKDLLLSLKNYDDSMSHGGDLELSFRAWLCEEGIKIVLCSRVAVHDALKPLVIRSQSSIIRIAEVWMPSYKLFVYRQTGIRSTSDETEAIRERKSNLRERMKSCYPFMWYVDSIAKINTPSPDMRRYGKLQVEEMFCARRGKNLVVNLEPCKVYIYEQEAMFELTDDNLLLQGDECLVPGGRDLNLILEPCQVTGNGHKWSLTSDGHLVNLATIGKCASHMTERSDKGDLLHHIAMLPCTKEMTRSQTWTFVNF